MPLNKNMLDQLRKLQTQGVAFINPRSPISSHLESNGYIVYDRDAVDPADPNKIGYSITATGLAELGVPVATAPSVSTGFVSGPVAAPATVPAPIAQSGAIVAGAAPTRASTRTRLTPTVHATGARIKMPEIVRKGRTPGIPREETYPFSKLEAPVWDGHNPPGVGSWDYDSFFVEKTETNPNPTKSLAGTVSSANKRMAGLGKKFSIVHVLLDPEFQKEGARVLRVDGTLKPLAAAAT